MKVIKEGRPQTGWAQEMECTGAGNGGGGCGAVLLIEADDLFQTTRCARDEVDYYEAFKCVSCGVLTDPKGLPRVAVEAARKNGVRNP